MGIGSYLSEQKIKLQKTKLFLPFSNVVLPKNILNFYKLFKHQKLKNHNNNQAFFH